MAATTWYKLDNIGKFYAAQAGSRRQTVFRISAQMSEDVDGSCLQKALDKAIAIYPFFNVVLRSGFFWHYLEQSQTRPMVEPENLPVCFRMHVDRASVLFRVSFYKKRINLEVSHMISDGRGTLEFFKAIVGFYVEACYGVRDAVIVAEGTLESNSEDSFSANYERHKAAATPMPKAAHIKGWRDEYAPAYIEYHLSASAVRAKAKSIGVSVTALMIAAVISAIGKSLSGRQLKRSICLNVPVDLRSLFHSETLRNFFGLSYVAYPAAKAGDPIEVIAKSVNDQIIRAVEPEALKQRMNRMIKLEKSPLLRFAPVFMKDAVLEIADRIAAGDVTTAVSNLGVVEMPETVSPYVTSINVLTSTSGINFTAVTYGDDLSLGISSVYASDIIPSALRDAFAKIGIVERPTTNPFPNIPIKRTSMLARVSLAVLTLVAMAAVIALCVWAGTSAWYCILACAAVALNYVFVRNILIHSPQSMRTLQRYFLVVVAMSLLWFFATGDTGISTFVVPTACILGSLFDVAILLVFKSKFIVGYAKYILFAIVIGAIPLILMALGCITWPPIAWASAACAAALLAVSFIVGHSSMTSEIKKLLHN